MTHPGTARHTDTVVKMPRTRSLPALVVAPLVTLGSLLAHQAAHLVATPHASARDAALRATGHGYLDHAGLILGSLVVAALAGAIVHALRSASSGRRRAWSPMGLAFVVPACFLVQETIERIVSGSLSPASFSDPALVLGLLLQVPFALIAYAVARRVLDVAAAVTTAIRSLFDAERPVVRAGASSRPGVRLSAARGTVLVGVYAGRAPPVRS